MTTTCNRWKNNTKWPAAILLVTSLVDSWIVIIPVSKMFVNLLYESLLYMSKLYVSLLYVSLLYVSLLYVRLLYVSLLYVSLLYVSLLYVSLLYVSLIHVSLLHVSLLYVFLLHVSLLYVSILYMSFQNFCKLLLICHRLTSDEVHKSKSRLYTELLTPGWWVGPCLLFIVYYCFKLLFFYYSLTRCKHFLQKCYCSRVSDGRWP